MIYKILPTSDHDKKLRYEKTDVYCYSKKQLDRLYTEKEYQVVGEAKAKNKKREIARLLMNAKKDPLTVSQSGSHSSLLYKRAGYVRVGSDEFITLLTPRWPFLLILLGTLALAALLLSLLFKGPQVLTPDHPLPPKDPYIQPMEDDNSEKAPVEEGGGSVSMIYTLEANVSLSTGEVAIYFKNPNASSHNVAVQLYLLNGEQEVLVAQSGLIEAGYALDRLDLMTNTAVLSEGVYTGLYKLQCYDPQSGERALVAPEITGVTVTVRN